MRRFAIILSVGLLAACGDSGSGVVQPGPDAATEDSVADVSTSIDTAQPDTVQADTTEPDTAVEDLYAADATGDAEYVLLTLLLLLTMSCANLKATCAAAASALARSMMCSSMGLPARGTSGLGHFSVCGISRLPFPPVIASTPLPPLMVSALALPVIVSVLSEPVIVNCCDDKNLLVSKADTLITVGVVVLLKVSPDKSMVGQSLLATACAVGSC